MSVNGEPPRILALSPWDRVIGPNRYLVELLRCLPGLSARACVVSHRASDSLDEYQALGCRTAAWPEISQVRARASLANAISLLTRHTVGLLRVEKRVRPLAPELIVSNTEQLMLGGMLARRLEVAHVKIFHALTFAHRLEGRPRLQGLYALALTAGCDRIVAVSETLRKALVAAGVDGGKVVTVPNPFAIDALQTASRAPLPEELARRLGNRPVLLNVGRICPLKGQEQLLRALPAVRAVHPDVLCVFAGAVGETTGIEDTAAYSSQMQARIEREGLRGNVIFVGEVEFVPALMRRADLCVHTSWMESFCRVVAEALLCDTAVVAYASGAVPETAGPGAVCVRTGDVAALSQAIIALLGDRERREALASAGREHVERHYAAPVVARQFSALLEGLVPCAG